MADVKVKMNVSGLSELEKTLADMPKELQEKIMKPALEAGGEVIRKGAERRIHSRSGRTAKALAVVVQVSGSRPGGVAAIGAGGKREHVLRFLEFGTRPHEIPKKGKKTKKKGLAFGGRVVKKVQHPGTKPQAPLTRSLGEGSRDAIDAFRKVAWEGIQAFARQRNTRA